MKLRVGLLLVVLVTILASLAPAVKAEGGNSPAGLIAAGWDCVLREGKYVYCMVPFWKKPAELPAAVINKVFLTQDLNATDAPFVGTSTYLRWDLYAEQPCPSSDQIEWVLMPFGGGLYKYYYCRHLVQ
jgi:hypothetical protein